MKMYPNFDQWEKVLKEDYLISSQVLENFQIENIAFNKTILLLRLLNIRK